jgi:hypothetical protein
MGEDGGMEHVHCDAFEYRNRLLLAVDSSIVQYIQLV